MIQEEIVFLLQKPDNWKLAVREDKLGNDWSLLASNSNKVANWHRRRETVNFRASNLAFGNGKAIILIRNPYDAIISLWTHMFLDGARNELKRNRAKRNFLSDYTTSQTPRFPEPPLHRPKFQAFARREIQLWEEIYSDFLATIPNLLVLHFEVVSTYFMILWQG